MLSVAFGSGALWVATGSLAGGELRKIDPVSGKVLATVGVGWAPSAVAAENGSVWVVDSIGDASLPANDPRQNTVLRIDAQSTTVAAHVSVDQPNLIALAGGEIWVTNKNGELLRLDARSLSPLGRISLDGGQPTFLRAAGDMLFVTVSDPITGAGRLVVVDATAMRIATDSSPQAAYGPVLPTERDAFVPVAVPAGQWQIAHFNAASGAVDPIADLPNDTDGTGLAVETETGWGFTSGGSVFEFDLATGTLDAGPTQVTTTPPVGLALTDTSSWLATGDAIVEVTH